MWLNNKRWDCVLWSQVSFLQLLPPVCLLGTFAQANSFAWENKLCTIFWHSQRWLTQSQRRAFLWGTEMSTEMLYCLAEPWLALCKNWTDVGRSGALPYAEQTLEGRAEPAQVTRVTVSWLQCASTPLTLGLPPSLGALLQKSLLVWSFAPKSGALPFLRNWDSRNHVVHPWAWFMSHSLLTLNLLLSCSGVPQKHKGSEVISSCVPCENRQLGGGKGPQWCLCRREGYWLTLY